MLHIKVKQFLSHSVAARLQRAINDKNRTIFVLFGPNLYCIIITDNTVDIYIHCSNVFTKLFQTVLFGYKLGTPNHYASPLLKMLQDINMNKANLP